MRENMPNSPSFHNYLFLSIAYGFQTNPLILPFTLATYRAIRRRYVAKGHRSGAGAPNGSRPDR